MSDYKYTEFENLQDALKHNPKWSGKFRKPEVGETVKINFNNFDLAIVKKYFIECGWLGMICECVNPPEWFLKQNEGNVPAHFFGIDIQEINP